MAGYDIKARSYLQDWPFSCTGRMEDNVTLDGKCYKKEVSCGKEWKGVNRPQGTTKIESDGSLCGGYEIYSAER